MSKRKSWDKKTMMKAIKCVTEDGMSVKQVVRELKVPCTSMRNYLKKLEQSDMKLEQLINIPLGWKTVLPRELEQELPREIQFHMLTIF